MSYFNPSPSHPRSTSLRSRRSTGEERWNRGKPPAVVLALLGFTSGFTSARGQWQTNPILADAPVEADTPPFLMVPVAGGVASVDASFTATRLDEYGNPAGERLLLAFEYGGELLQLGSASGLVGCSLGEDRFAIAFRVAPLSVFGDTLRVAQFHYVADEDSYALDYDPVAVGDGTHLSIAPNVQSDGSVDGVLLAWRRHGSFEVNGGTLVYSREIRQQGVRGDGSLMWGGPAATDGALVWSGDVIDDPIDDTPDVVSDGEGLAIVTYRVRSDGVSMVTDPNAFRFHWTTKLDAVAAEAWSCAVPGQIGHSPGVCLVVRDGSGGAFYAYANDVVVSSTESRTDLIRARVDKAGATKEAQPFWTNSPITPLLRPLAVAPTRQNSAVFAYRDLTGIRSIAVGDAAGLPLLWTTFLHGASAENSDQADGVLGPSYVAFAWNTGERVVTKGLDEVDGSEIWGSGNEVWMNHYSTLLPMGVAPIEPRIVPTPIDCGFFSAGFIVGWRDGVSPDEHYFAERVNDGGFTAPPCPGKWEGYGFGLAGTGGVEPTLLGFGYPAPGNVVSLSIMSEASFAPCALFLGFSSTSLPFMGGTLNVAPPLFLLTLPLGPTGDLDLPLLLPNDPGLTGVNVYMQGAILDAGAVHGVALTKGLLLGIG